MDNLGWDTTSCPWSNDQQNVNGDQSPLIPSSSTSCGILGCKMDLSQDVFYSIPEVQSTTTTTCDIEPAMNSINAAAAPTPAWGEALMAQYIVSQNTLANGLVTDFSVNGIEDGKAGLLSGVTVSLESLDCLLSATNSINTDTSVEDDGISMILSADHCRTPWNFSSNPAVSSGESEITANNHREMVKQACEPVEEAVSVVSQQGSSKAVDPVTITTTTARKPNSTNKRSKVDMNYHYFDLLQSDSSTTEGGFQLISENPPRSKKPRLENHHHQGSANINFQHPSSSSLSSSVGEPDTEAIAQMKEMIYRAAVFRPVNLGMEVLEKPRRKNVKISSDPQTVAARHRRERISERIRVLQRLVPGGSKMDTATMLDEAANYLKFLRSQVKALENMGNKLDNCDSAPLPLSSTSSFNFRHPFPMQTFFPLPKP